MLSQELDRETERYLADILEQERTTSDALIRQLIRDRWLSLYPQKAASSAQEIQETTPLPPELPPTELSQPSASQSPVMPVARQPRPKNSKQMIADFVRRKNGRSF
jgi:hypothetical protein